MADNCNSTPAVTQSPVAGTVISGTTTITLTADDGSGNTASCTFNVIPADNTNPTISCPSNQTANIDGSCDFTLPDYTSLATVSDNCDAAPVVTQSPVAGTTISGAGTVQTVTLTATDASGNTANCTFDVTVVDNTNPTIICPGNIASCNPVVNGIAPTVTDNCSGVTVSYTLTGVTTGTGAGAASGTTFNIGTTTVTYFATDVAGNTDQCSFNVVINVIPVNTPTALIGCDSITYNGMIYYTSTMVNDTAFGGAFNTCDSITNQQITINEIDATVTSTSPILTANQTNASYRWLDCNNSFAVIPSETNQAYTATSNGNYAVEITIGSCTDTSACENIIMLGVEINEFANNLIVYPNPTTGNISINLGDIKNAGISISNITGKVVYTLNKINKTIVEISLAEFSKGVYFIKIQNESQQKVIKLIKQ
ncbi:MAG: HYR domain-containing protein [Flavobacteriales bacterium]|nr:HYR domain-containing protein [Flavobacteriales bacterium]